MAAVRPRRAGPLWLWLLGLVILLVTIWIVVDLVVDRGEVAVEDGAPAAEATVEREMALRDVEAVGVPAPVDRLIPLGDADTGARVSFDGRALAVVEDGAWIRTAEETVLFLRLLDGADGLDAGARLAGTGVVRYDSEGRLDAWSDAASLSAPTRDARLREYYVETSVDRLDTRRGRRR